MPLRPAALFTPFRPAASFTRPSRPLLHRPAMPPKRLSKALAGASSDEDYADLADPPFPPHGEAPSPRAKAKKAKKAPAATSSQPGSGDLVQDGWVSMHNDGVPFVMWKCVWFFFFTSLCACAFFGAPVSASSTHRQALGCSQEGRGVGGPPRPWAKRLGDPWVGLANGPACIACCARGPWPKRHADILSPVATTISLSNPASLLT
jgi:hypothetical protein